MEFIYLAVVFIVAIVWFSLLKRPLYEGILLSFIILLLITNTWKYTWNYVFDALRSPSLYVIIVFIVSANLLSKTTVIDDCIAIILSLFGRLTGGAGYVAIIGSTYMGSLSGSGPGNVATTGVFTIPAMKNSGFPAHLAANVEAHASTMGNMIPPAGMIAIAFAELDKLYPNTYTMSQFWLLLWGVALIFVLQRIVTMYFMCKYYKVTPMEKSSLPSLRVAIKQGWKAIFLPIIVFMPFLIDSKCSVFFISRLGIAGAKAFSNSILLFIPALIVICAIFLSGKNVVKKFTLKYIFNNIANDMTKVVPTGILVLFAYFVSNCLDNINVGVAIGEFIGKLNMNFYLLLFCIPLFTAILGMLIPGSTQVKLFGTSIITIIATAGGNPLLAAAMLPCICGAMHGVTPPYATCVYIAMGIAEADFNKTMKNCLIWVVIHYVLSVIILSGLIPIFGLN